jgi:3-isopropylmalate/(R)-2-methylmalate dehydratase small subunit
MDSNIISGKAYVLGDHIDTDQILTAEYLKINPSTQEGFVALGRLAMCGLPEGLPRFVDPDTGVSDYRIVIAGENFGCGSSREHAVIALGAAGVQAVVARSFARIFFRNCVSTGQLLPVTVASRVCERIRTGDVVEIDLARRAITCPARDLRVGTEPIGELAHIVAAGGLFAYGRAQGKVPALASEA